MKELRVKIGLVENQKRNEEEKDIVMETMCVLGRIVDDAAFILENVIYPNEEGIVWFFEHFCEHLIDFRVVDKMLYDYIWLKNIKNGIILL